MPSPADRFTRMQKLAIFLIALGQERTREVLEDVDLDSIEHLNAAIRGLGPVSAGEKASVMLEFAQFFFGNQTLTELGQEPVPPDTSPAPPAGLPPKGGAPARRQPRPDGPTPRSGDAGRPGRPAGTGWVLPGGEKPETGEPETGKPDESEENRGRAQADEEHAILTTLEQLRRRLDPGQIDWGRAGYDFGDGFKGPDQDRR